MSRSVKKGPFVSDVLYDRIQAMNESGKKTVVKTWSRSSTIFPEFVGHTGKSTFRCTSPRKWSGTSWASSPPPAPSVATGALRSPLARSKEESYGNEKQNQDRLSS